MSGWSLTTIRESGAGATSAAIRRADGTLVVPDVLLGYPGLFEALGDWERVGPILRDVDPSTLEPTDGDELLAVRYPRKVLCVGANYRDHLAEMGVSEIPEGVEPFFFSIPPTTALIGDGQAIVLGDRTGLRVDWEAELAVVIGRGGRDIPASEALEHVAGYACFNDVTARSLMRRATAIAPPFTWDWAASKGRDTFAPLGAMTPAWQVANPDDLGIRCLVNDVVKQDGTTRNLIVGIAALISAASHSWTLEPGDIIATGTPAGVGQGRGEELHDGDSVVVEIDGLASLTNPVRTSAPVPAAAS